MLTRQQTVSPLIMWLIVAMGIVGVFAFVPARFVFPSNAFLSFLVYPAIIYWIYFFTQAFLVHKKAPLSVAKIDKLVTEGVYAQVRHPIYSADIVLGWAVFFFYPDVRFLIGAHWLMFVLLFWIRREEKALTEKFGDEYLAYMRRVPKLFPRI